MAAITPNLSLAVSLPTLHRSTMFSVFLRVNRKPTRRIVLSSSGQNTDPDYLSPVRIGASAIEGGLSNDIEQASIGSVEVNRFSPAIDDGDCGVGEDVYGYFEQAAILVKLTVNGGGPRWFCPVECGRPHLKGAPLLLYLPGIDGVEIRLVRQH